MKFKQAIHVGKNVNGIFQLPCVKAVYKDDEGKPVFDTFKGVAFEGDWLCEGYDGSWHCLSDDGYRNLCQNKYHK